MATISPNDNHPTLPVSPADSFTSRQSPTPVPATTNGAAASVPAKLKRFRFTETQNMVLLKCVRSVDAHLPNWGKAEALNEEFLKLFLREVPSKVFTYPQTPSPKTLSDCFKRLVARRQEDVKGAATASGIIEEHGEKEVLLDDLIMEMDEKKDATRLEKQQQTDAEKRLVAAGETIRAMALKRKKTSSSEDCEVDEGTESSAKKKKSRKAESAHSDDDITTSMMKHATERREMEGNRLALERERIDIEREKAKTESERFEMTQQATNRRLDLDDKRFELEKEERKQSLVERKKMLDVMELLCRKLQ